MQYADIRIIEHSSLRAWPALETQAYDGWLLRYAKGYTGRANSVQALEASSLPVAEKITHCEAWYTEHGLPCTFRLTEAMQPPTLDADLAARGYQRQKDTLVLIAPLAAMIRTTDARFHSNGHLTNDWLSAWAMWNEVPAEHRRTAQQMLAAQTLPSCYGWVDDVAVGLAVCEGHHVGLFDIVVQPQARRKGYGRVLINGLLAWARQQGATTAYLQVANHNAPARSLYDKLGFTAHHHYWYRTQI